MIRSITMPDRITYDAVVAALNALGLDSGDNIQVTMSTDKVTVETGRLDSSLTRTYTVNGFSVRYGPKENGNA
jgi:hypothetical protein